MDTVYSLVNGMADQRPDAVFAVAPETGCELRWADLRNDCEALTRFLRARGLTKGDKVSFMLDNGCQSLELFLGAMYGGFVVSPLNALAQPSQLRYVLEHSDTRIVFVAEHYRETLDKALDGVSREVPVVTVDVDDRVPPEAEASARPSAEPVEIRPEDEALLMYTSGTTGKPKGVLLTHANMLAGGHNTVLAHNLTGEDRALCVLPLYHINAQCVTVMAPLVSGGSVVLPHRFSVSRFWDQVVGWGCTWFSVVPTIISYLLDRTDPYRDGVGPKLQGVRFGRSASAPLAPSLHREFEERYRMPMIETMGLTETAGQILSNPLPPGERKVGSPGLPYGNEVKVVDERRKELPAGEVGEILVRGANVMKMYYKNPEATAADLDVDGWFHTGDLAYRDEDGYFFITGRLKELIIKGGENIAPREIDEVLYRHPAVLEAAAVGVSHHHYGQDIAAFVVLRSGTSCPEQELREFCVGELGRFKSPARILFTDTLPKGPSGKIQRLKLAEHPALKEEPPGPGPG